MTFTSTFANAENVKEYCFYSKHASMYPNQFNLKMQQFPLLSGSFKANLSGLFCSAREAHQSVCGREGRGVFQTTLRGRSGAVICTDYIQLADWIVSSLVLSSTSFVCCCLFTLRLVSVRRSPVIHTHWRFCIVSPNRDAKPLLRSAVTILCVPLITILHFILLW